MKTMEKKLYVTPETEKVWMAVEKLMITASPGVDGDYDPNLPIESKRFDFLDKEEDDNVETGFRIHSLWND